MQNSKKSRVVVKATPWMAIIAYSNIRSGKLSANHSVFPEPLNCTLFLLNRLCKKDSSLLAFRTLKYAIACTRLPFMLLFIAATLDLTSFAMPIFVSLLPAWALQM